MDQAYREENQKMTFPLASLQWFQNHPLSATFFVLIASLFIFVCLSRVASRGKQKLPPSPPKLPIIGHLHHLGTLQHRSFQALSQKYGPLILLDLGFHPTLLVSSAEMAREIMKTNDIAFSSRPVTKASREFVYGGKDIAFAPYGDHWRHMRKICSTNLFNPNKVKALRDFTEKEMAIMVNKVKASCSLRKGVNLGDMIIVANSNVTTRNTAGTSLEENDGATIMKEVTDHFGVFSFEDMFPSLGWIDFLTGLARKMRKTSKQAHGLMDKVIQEHLTSKDERNNKDLVDILLESEHDSTLGFEFTRESIRSVILNIFIAGTETSYVTAEWAMAELLRHPSMMKKLQEEIRGVAGEKRRVEEDDINQMHYLSCVIKETLRLHPATALSIPRESTADAVVGGYHIPAKTRVIINLWAISRDPNFWDRPTDFIPERFLNNSVDFRGKDFEFIPFGAGRRSCPGITFAVTSVEYILTNLLYWFDWELADGSNNVDIDMTEQFGLTVRLKNPLHLVPVSHFTWDIPLVLNHILMMVLVSLFYLMFFVYILLPILNI